MGRLRDPTGGGRETGGLPRPDRPTDSGVSTGGSLGVVTVEGTRGATGDVDDGKEGRSTRPGVGRRGPW